MNVVLMIEVYNISNKKIEFKYVKDFDIKEDYIIGQSKIKYSTDEPCIIYRTIIRNMILIKCDDYFRSQLRSEIVIFPISDLPDYLIESLIFNKDAYYLKIK